MVVESEAIAREDSPATPAYLRGSWLVAQGMTATDVLVLLCGVVLCIGNGPFEFTSWTPRMAAMLIALPLGVVVMGRLAWRRDRASIAAFAFLTWSTVVALMSAAPRMSLLGQINGNSQSVLIFCGVFGFCALGRTMSNRGRSLVGSVLSVALAFNGLVGLIQVVLQLPSGVMAAAGGRAGGLEGNAVYFSALQCAGFAWCAWASLFALTIRGRRWGLAGVVWFALTIGLSGSRGSTIAMVVVVGAVWWRAGGLRPVRVAAATVSGSAAAWVIQHAVKSANTVQRLVSGGSAERVEMWRAAVGGFLDRPITGWGLGQVRPGIQRHFSDKYVRDYAFDDYRATLTDVHNVVLQMLVSVGIVGVVLLLVFVAFALRKAHFGLALGAGAVSINWLLQPSLYSLPVAAVFLGAAMAHVELPEPVRRSWQRRTLAAAAALGFLAGGYLVVADVHFLGALRNGDPHQVRQAAAWFPDDPYVIDQFVVDSYDPGLPEEQQPREAAARRLTELEPDMPNSWSELAMTQYDLRDMPGMKASIDTALRLQPNHTRSWVQMAMYAQQVGDQQLLESALQRACDLGAPVCRTGSATLDPAQGEAGRAP